MSIASELTNLEGNIGDAYDAVSDMSGIIPQHKNMANLDQAIRTIPQSQGATYTAGNGINIDANNEISIDDTVVAELSDLPGVMTGATSGTAGTSGLVPAPAAGDEAKVLSGAGTWVNQPTVPTVNDATLTIQHNGTNVQTFTANQSTAATANIETIYATTVQPVSQVAPIATGQIQDGAVTAPKIDWSTIFERQTFTVTLDNTGNAELGVNTANHWILAVNQIGSGAYVNGNAVSYTWSSGKYFIHVDQNYGHAYSTGSITVEVLLLKRSAIGF